MTVMSVAHGSGLALSASLIYGISLIVLLPCQRLSRSSQSESKRNPEDFRSYIDLPLIAGSYTPFCLVALAGNSRGTCGNHRSMGPVQFWASCSSHRSEKDREVWYGTLCHHGMVDLAVFRDIIHVLPAPAFWLLLIGGISYTGGLVFYALKNVKYMHSIWHLFVLAGSVLHYLCISIYVLPMAY